MIAEQVSSHLTERFLLPRIAEANIFIKKWSRTQHSLFDQTVNELRSYLASYQLLVQVRDIYIIIYEINSNEIYVM